jgi:exopolysaccharide biosynthesis polyprenyl glycosylphosphotransferase
LERYDEASDGAFAEGTEDGSSADVPGLRQLTRAPQPAEPDQRRRSVRTRAEPAVTTSARPARAAMRPRWWRDRRRRRLLAVADAIVAAGIGAVIAGVAGAPGWWAIAAVPAGILLAKMLGLYDADHRAIRHLTIDEVPAIVVWCAALAIACALVAPETLSVMTFALILPPAIGLAAGLRALARFVWRRTTPPESTLVVGTGEPAEAIARKIALFPDMHLELRGTHGPADHLERINGNGSGSIDQALSGIDRVVLAWSGASPEFVRRLLGHCRRYEVKLSVVSPFRGYARPALRLSQVADLPVLEYNTWDVPRSTAALKRGFDIVISCAALVVLAPLFAVLALAIKLDDGGPVFFRQRRAGRKGKPFTIVKFRSMDVDAEERLPGLVDLDALPDPMFKLRPDPRITRVGRFLRRFSLDELPQLTNVLKGEMSLVGPRPEEVPVTDRYQAEHRFRLAVKPGVTGPMQVFGRGELSFEERLAVEIDYVENISITRDLWLLAQTLPAVARGTGAF